MGKKANHYFKYFQVTEKNVTYFILNKSVDALG